MNKILVIDDESGIRSILQDILEDEGYSVVQAEDGQKGLYAVGTEAPDLVILDVWLPNMGGIEVLEKIKEKWPDLPVIIISGHATLDIAVKAVKIGAYDFLEKPLSMDKLLNMLEKALEFKKLKAENTRLKMNSLQNDQMVGESTGMKQIRGIIDQAAPTDARVLILGSNGTGKELIAREIHNKSNRAGGPFIEVNCAAIPDNLIESELFGHERGAFTNAVNRRKGKFELAHNGTIFLDEVADMGMSAQAKVLRVIQELQFERVGGEESIQVDVRIIAATNKDIQQEIQNGNFREDLFFRLNVIPINVPTLAERSTDIPLLLHYFMEKYKPQGEEAARAFTGDAMGYLSQYQWPGNIRQLKNFCERINVMTEDQIIELSTVNEYLSERNLTNVSSFFEEYVTMKLGEARELFEKRLIEIKLKECDNNISKTAEALGVYPSNLHGKLKKYGIKNEK